MELEGNQLSGTLTAAECSTIPSKSGLMIYIENSGLSCYDDSCSPYVNPGNVPACSSKKSSTSSRNVTVDIAIVVPVIVVLLLLIGVGCYYYGRKKSVSTINLDHSGIAQVYTNSPMGVTDEFRQSNPSRV